MLTMFTGVVIPFGNGLNLRSESGAGAVEAVDSMVVFLTLRQMCLKLQGGLLHGLALLYRKHMAGACVLWLGQLIAFRNPEI